MSHVVGYEAWRPNGGPGRDHATEGAADLAVALADEAATYVHERGLVGYTRHVQQVTEAVGEAEVAASQVRDRQLATPSAIRFAFQRDSFMRRLASAGPIGNTDTGFTLTVFHVQMTTLDCPHDEVVDEFL